MTSLSYDAIENMSGGSGSGDIPTGYDESAYFTISSTTDADTFSSRFHHSTDSSIPSYYDSTTGTTLALGNRININDGTYNTQWMIAGFDVEYNRTASDGITYNNGYGIALIPVIQMGTAAWNASDTLTGAYTSSTMHTSTIPTRMSALQTVLGDHLVERDVLLSTAVSGSGESMNSSAYAWTKCYGTLMSIGQMTGTFASNSNKYDDGEANYKLPLFDNMEYKTGSNFWSRGVWGYYGSYYGAWYVYTGGSVYDYYVTSSDHGVRPLIYIR